jgi:hypothetical protein
MSPTSYQAAPPRAIDITRLAAPSQPDPRQVPDTCPEYWHADDARFGAHDSAHERSGGLIATLRDSFMNQKLHFGVSVVGGLLGGIMS